MSTFVAHRPETWANGGLMRRNTFSQVIAAGVAATTIATVGWAYSASAQGGHNPAGDRGRTGATAVGPAAVDPAVGPAAVAPGLDPGIEHWFLVIDKARAAFNDVLLRAEQDIAKGVDTGSCTSLLADTAVITRRLPDLSKIANGGPAIAAAYQLPLNEFAAVATACKNHDFATARSTLGDTTRGAIADYGDAQDRVDEILDAGA